MKLGDDQLWGILTAGHVFHEYDERLRTSTRESDNHRAWDGWPGGESVDERWTTFDPFKFPHDYQWEDNDEWKHEKGVDIGVVMVPAFVLRSFGHLPANVGLHSVDVSVRNGQDR